MENQCTIFRITPFKIKIQHRHTSCVLQAVTKKVVTAAVPGAKCSFCFYFFCPISFKAFSELTVQSLKSAGSHKDVSVWSYNLWCKWSLRENVCLLRSSVVWVFPRCYQNLLSKVINKGGCRPEETQIQLSKRWSFVAAFCSLTLH